MRPPARSTVRLEAVTPHLFRPAADRPVRAKESHLHADTEVLPHAHAWAQLATSTTGVVRVTVEHGTFIVPPSRAVWIPPGVEHAVTVVEDSDLRTLYFHQPRGRCGPEVPREAEAAWRQCRVLEVSPLLRALVAALDTRADAIDDGDSIAMTREDLERERHLGALVMSEVRAANPVPLGVDLPRDKRLRSLCKSVLTEPTRHGTLEGWAAESGASPRTVARLFRQELGTTFLQWRQQVLLARALAMAAHRKPIGHIAAELGYASASAFTAMVTRTLGAPPSRLFGTRT